MSVGINSVKWVTGKTWPRLLLLVVVVCWFCSRLLKRLQVSRGESLNWEEGNCDWGNELPMPILGMSEVRMNEMGVVV